MDNQAVSIFKALSDEIRLRLVRAITYAELSVAELVQVLGLPQSTVSRHLKPLRDVGLVDARREGTSVFYHTGTVFEEEPLRRLLTDQLEQVPLCNEDRATVQRILHSRKQRSKDFFDEVAGKYETLTDPGGGWQALCKVMAAGFSGQQTADLGCGEGALTMMLAPYAAHVTAVDQSERMLEQLREKARRGDMASRVSCVQADLESLPLDDGMLDAVFLSQVLHHAARPEAAIAEAARILKPGGLLLMLDLYRHDLEWVRDQWADQWLGFEPEQVQLWMQQAGLSDIRREKLSGSMPELSVMIMTGQKQK